MCEGAYRPPHGKLLQPRVFRLGLLQDGDVGVGVFPQGKKLPIRNLGFARIALHGESPGRS